MAPGLVAVGETPSVKRAIDGTGGANITSNARADGAGAGPRCEQCLGGRPVRRAHQPREAAAGRRQPDSGHPVVLGQRARQRRPDAASSAPRPATIRPAQNLRDVVKGFLGLARMQAGDKPEMQALVSSLQVSGTGRTVALSFSLPAEVIQTLGAVAAAAKDHHERRGPTRRPDDSGAPSPGTSAAGLQGPAVVVSRRRRLPPRARPRRSGFPDSDSRAVSALTPCGRVPTLH